MGAGILAWLVLTGAAAGGSTGVPAGRVPPIPEKPAAQVFTDAPAPWHDYLVKARAAERIADPLQRCLAFPDLPGNHWPAGHAAAHCRFLALRRHPVLSLDAVAGYLSRHDAAGLRTRLDGYLARHFDSRRHGEDIHTVFDQFHADARSDRLSLQWLQQAPADPYANLARARYLVAKAWKERGGQYAKDTPASNMENMDALVDRSVPLFQKAIEFEPQLMPAYIGLMDAAMLIGRRDLIDAAFARAIEQDPACLFLVRQRMRTLLPRWGGSYPALQAYMEQLEPLLGAHPGIAIYLPMAYEDRASYEQGDDYFKAPSAALLDKAVAIGSYVGTLDEAADIALNRVDAPSDPWRALALLLQEARFKRVDAWADRMIGWRLVRQEPEWALKYLARAQKQGPSSPWLHYLLGAAYYNTRQYAAAQRHYLIAIEDPDQRQASLEELGAMWLNDRELSRRQGAAKARPFVDRLLSEYPDDGQGWILRFECLHRLGRGVPMEDIRKFLAVADHDDPEQARLAASLRAALDKAGIPGK